MNDESADLLDRKRPVAVKGGRAATPSIHDVARAAGVSITTVSHAFHGTRYVAAATRARIQAAATRLGYQPNRLARGLRTQRTQTVGMLVSHLRNPLVASYVEGAEAALGAAGYGLVLAATHLEPEQEQRGVALVRQLRADGVIVAVPSPGLLAALGGHAGERPVVLINARPEGGPPGSDGPAPAVAAVVVDEARAGHEATAHLLRLGHRRIALIQRGVPLWSFTQRLAGYRRALDEAGRAFDPALVLEHEPPEAPAAALVARLLALADPPTAAYVAHNLVALRLVAALQDAGVAVPNRLALVVSADEDWMQVVRPRLTAIALPAWELGAAAARLLLRRLGVEGSGAGHDGVGMPGDDQVVVLRAPLIVRESCGASRQGGA